MGKGTSLTKGNSLHPDGRRRFRFTKRVRLLSPRQFKRVYEARIRKSIGPLLIYGAANDVGYDRLGLSISRSAGSAIARNHIKRMLRESFRLIESPTSSTGAGYDFIVNVRLPHSLRLDEYQHLLMRAFPQIHQAWQRTAIEHATRTQRPRKAQDPLA